MLLHAWNRNAAEKKKQHFAWPFGRAHDDIACEATLNNNSPFGGQRKTEVPLAVLAALAMLCLLRAMSQWCSFCK